MSAVALDPKVTSGLVARACLIGVVLHVLEDDAGQPLFVASKWAMTKQMHSVDEVLTFLRKAGAPL
jgi:hypothetical protein